MFVFAMSVELCVKVAANIFGIAEGGDYQHQFSIEKPKFILLLNCHKSTPAPLLAIPCFNALFVTGFENRHQLLYRLRPCHYVLKMIVEFNHSHIAFNPVF